MGAEGVKWNVKKQAVFYGSHDLTLDPKHRLSVPAAVRRCIVPERDGDAFFAIIGLNKKIWLFTENAYIDQAEQPLNMTPGDDEMAYNQLWYGTATRVEMDGQGRILIPDKILKKTETTNDVTVVGNRDHLQIWNQQDWLAREAELEAKRSEIAALRAERAKLMNPPRE